jgi:hypothetical protein
MSVMDRIKQRAQANVKHSCWPKAPSRAPSKRRR